MLFSILSFLPEYGIKVVKLVLDSKGFLLTLRFGLGINF